MDRFLSWLPGWWFQPSEYVCMYIYIYIYIYIWAAEVIWYKTQLTGCSYLVLQSRHVLGGLTSFSNAALVFNSQMLYVRCLPRSRGVPTSFYRLIMIFLTNRGTPQYYSLFNQIKSVAHIVDVPCLRNLLEGLIGTRYSSPFQERGHTPFNPVGDPKAIGRIAKIPFRGSCTIVLNSRTWHWTQSWKPSSCW